MLSIVAHLVVVSETLSPSFTGESITTDSCVVLRIAVRFVRLGLKGSLISLFILLLAHARPRSPLSSLPHALVDSAVHVVLYEAKALSITYLTSEPLKGGHADGPRHAAAAPRGWRRAPPPDGRRRLRIAALAEQASGLTNIVCMSACRGKRSSPFDFPPRPPPRRPRPGQSRPVHVRDAVFIGD